MIFGKTTGGGLLPLPKDSRDFSHAVVFGSIKKEQIPTEDYIVPGTKFVKQQYDTDFCTAAGGTAVSEDQEGVELDFLYQFALVCKVRGRINGWGADLRTACKSFCQYGSIPKEIAPYTLEDGRDRDFYANIDNYDPKLINEAEKYKKKSFFDVASGPHDTFDNLRSALFKNKNEKCSIITGSTWYSEWNSPVNGIIPKEYSGKTGGHAFKVCGQKTINGELHLVAQMSAGQYEGDKGFVYFPREVVNKEFTYGAFCFKDMDKDTAKYYSENGMNKDTSPFQQIFTVLWNILKTIYKKLL